MEHNPLTRSLFLLALPFISFDIPPSLPALSTYIIHPLDFITHFILYLSHTGSHSTPVLIGFLLVHLIHYLIVHFFSAALRMSDRHPENEIAYISIYDN